jgi:hypothetical protein
VVIAAMLSVVFQNHLPTAPTIAALDAAMVNARLISVRIVTLVQLTVLKIAIVTIFPMKKTTAQPPQIPSKPTPMTMVSETPATMTMTVMATRMPVTVSL